MTRDSVCGPASSVQLYHRDWDHHDGLRNYLPQNALETDRGCAALVRDLKERGMLDETLVVWAGEFGRTPMAQTNKGAPGRDHHNKGFSIWLAGGGIKRGITFGATDELGYRAIEKSGDGGGSACDDVALAGDRSSADEHQSSRVWIFG